MTRLHNKRYAQASDMQLEMRSLTLYKQTDNIKTCSNVHVCTQVLAYARLRLQVRCAERRVLISRRAVGVVQRTDFDVSL